MARIGRPPLALPEIGEIIGLWTVIGAPVHMVDYWVVLCRCECGVERPVRTQRLRTGQSRMCSGGKHTPQVVIHGMVHTPEHRAWSAMKHRCSSPKNPAFSHYGGRGITVCARWMEFTNFIADVGLRPSDKHSLDRFPDPNGNYEPGNVRWATRIEQQNNTTKNVFLEHSGKRMTVAEWAHETGISIHAMYKRIEYGWDDSRIVTEPINYRGQNQPPSDTIMLPLAIVAAADTLA